MRRSSAKGVVTSCPIGELEERDRWQIVDPFDITTGARLHHSNNESSSDGEVEDKVVTRKRQLQTSSSRMKKRKKHTSIVSLHTSTHTE